MHNCTCLSILLQIRLQHLTREQEKTIVEMEKAVSFRDIIVTRGEATAKSAAKGVLTRNTFQVCSLL